MQCLCAFSSIWFGHNQELIKCLSTQSFKPKDSSIVEIYQVSGVLGCPELPTLTLQLKILQQVDILISKNQALQILNTIHIKLHARNLPVYEIQENLIPTKINNHMHVSYSINSYTTISTSIPYTRQAFLAASCFNSGCVSSYEIIKICY